MSNDEEALQNKTGKTVSLESLTKDELVTKCKNFITLLKKAKTSKDVAEIGKLKFDHAKVIRQFEEERNKIERELETMQEIVNSSTENKMMLVTKNESLQRQLNLQLSEVEGMKKMLDSFTEEKETLLKEVNKLRLMATKQQKVVEQMREEREKIFHAETSWQEERILLIDKVETLEAQVEQSVALKTKYKNLLSEKDEVLRKLSEISAHQQQKTSLETEKKALEIVHNELKSQNIILEEKYKNCFNEKKELSLKLAELEQVAVKLTSAEEQLNLQRSELDSANESLSKLRQDYDTSISLVKELEKELEHGKEIQSKHHDEVEKLMKELASNEEKMNEMKERLKYSERISNEES
ncbi:hypothetical protein Avbf_07592 [Armadillidium vulgare]|nr:hypothetical protein Avbf_07592 [Armadillidium vulgare]